MDVGGNKDRQAADDPVTMTTGDVVEVPTAIDVGNERWMYYDYGQAIAPSAVGLTKAPLSYWSVYLPLTPRQYSYEGQVCERGVLLRPFACADGRFPSAITQLLIVKRLHRK